MTPPVNAMSVDVEDWFQVQAFAGTIDRSAWEMLPRRVEANTERILALFEASGYVLQQRHWSQAGLDWIAKGHVPEDTPHYGIFTDGARR